MKGVATALKQAPKVLYKELGGNKSTNQEL